MKFAYRRFSIEVEGLPQSHCVHRPVAPVEIQGDGVSLRLFALVDTGADFTLLPKYLADFLGIAPVQEQSTSISGVGGSTIPASPAVVRFKLTQGRESYQWQAQVYFADQEYLLLGNEGFLEFFIATFDWAGKSIELVPNSRFPSRNQ